VKYREEQLNYFHGNVNTIPQSIKRTEKPEEDTKELTNKDYFWDRED
jgi:hypothetical protein